MANKMFEWFKKLCDSNVFKVPDVTTHIAETTEVTKTNASAVQSVTVTTNGSGYASFPKTTTKSNIVATVPSSWISSISNYPGCAGGGGSSGGSGNLTGSVSNPLAPNMQAAYAGYIGHLYNITPNYTFATQTPSNIISITGGPNNKEIVRLNSDGSVVWANGYEVDEAAETFARMMSVSAEMAAGITRSMKLRIRDSVFEDIIGIAKEKGSLTADDLTYLLEASKIVEKLKGPKDDKK